MTVRSRVVVRVATVALAVVALGGACASASRPAAPRTPTSLDLAVLSPTALPGLARTDRPLTSAVLSRDANIKDIATQLVADGFLGGRERTFQGPSRHLTYVASRSLAFGGPAGAAAFLAFVQGHADAWFGSATQVSAVVSAGRRGFVFEPSACACHLANPVLVGVVQDGPRLAWLEINGPDTSRLLLLDLMMPSRSTEAG